MVQNRTYSKQNRPVTSCAECSRRKQRCDRQLPCRRCVARGAASKCSYDSRSQSPVQASLHHKRRKTSTKNTSPPDELRSAHEYESLSDRLGYQQQGDNALSVLEQVLDGDESKSRVTKSPLARLHSRKQIEFWKGVENLPPVPVVQSLVQAFFTEANWYFAVLDRFFFDAPLLQWFGHRQSETSTESLPLELCHFPSLLFQVLALAMQFLPPGYPYESNLKSSKGNCLGAASTKFSDQGDDLLDLLGRHTPSIISVQADLMRCAWLKNDGRGAEAWYSLGRAVRQAQQLDLHREKCTYADEADTSAEHLQDLWYAEHKRRLWATLFVWESHMSLQLGRPRMIHTSDCTLVDPIDCDFPLEPARTLLRTPTAAERPSSFTLQLVKYRIGRMIHDLMSAGATDPQLQDYGLIQSSHDGVFDLLKRLPPAMRCDNPDTSWDLVYPSLVKQRLQISIVAFSFLTALHRPHASRHVSSRRHATAAALHALQALQELFQQTESHQFKIYTLVFYTIDLGIFLAALAVKYEITDATIRKEIDQTLEQAVSRLNALKERNSAAGHGEVVLKRCVQRYHQMWAEAATIDVEPVLDPDPLNNSFFAKTASLSSLWEEEPATVGSEFTTGTTVVQEPLFEGDLFDDILFDRIPTTSWLERLDSLSPFDLHFDDGDLTWDNLYG